MQYEGTLSKMPTEIGNPIQYYLVFEDSFLNVNQLLGRDVSISFKGYQCLNCSKRKKIFRQGFCYDCFYSSPEVGDWIMRPELSTAHLGIADRDLEYESKVQLTPHVVYLALSSEVKVGVTRKTQVPTRWIDQGACEAVSILEVPNRYLAGITEVELKKHFVDKTNWRKMLQNEVLTLDLLEEKTRIFDFLPDEVKPFFNTDLHEHLVINYPVLEHPKKVVGLNLDKTTSYAGKLIGIKGQYLIFSDGTVFNVRSFEGYVVNISV
ncbi:DUF2797 domain-containing protein [Flavobacterium sp.]|uniref:DUF2797 domain-containing protein n=1 Tax=Flavobacterium sp. TaxID=239 RepID=UPI0012160D16|nr:DUF2797 domain-containing protein [Flavobacterium sp.]RZJ71368.1 MAG: DUF2797 domain-containing protein [Flavobacterium sp.]